MTTVLPFAKKLEPLINADQAAEYLGCSIVTVRRMSRRGELPCVHFRRRWKFRMSELQKYVNGLGRKQAAALPTPQEERPIRAVSR